jgi:hypothetical protein
MKHLLLFATLLAYRAAAAQSAPGPVPETGLQSTVNVTTFKNTPGVRYQYQLVYPDTYCVWLAPAWRGKTRLEPRHYMFNPNYVGEMEVMLMQTINELSADGWEFIEIRTESRPTGATQKIEKESQSTDADNAVYKSTTSFHINSKTRYLFRKPLLN